MYRQVFKTRKAYFEKYTYIFCAVIFIFKPSSNFFVLYDLFLQTQERRVAMTANGPRQAEIPAERGRGDDSE